METHSKWLLGITISTMVFSLIEIGLSLADGLFGAFSFWTAPATSALTLVFHGITLGLWNRITERSMKGIVLDQPLPFIYSTTFCILSCLFAIAWLGVASVTLFLVAAFSYGQSFLAATANDGIKGDPTSLDPTRGWSTSVPWAEAIFALLICGLTWAEFGIAINYRKRSLEKTKSTKRSSTFDQPEPAIPTSCPFDGPSIYPTPYSIPTTPGYVTTMTTNARVTFQEPQLYQCDSSALIPPNENSAVQQDASGMLPLARPVSIPRSVIPPAYSEETDGNNRQAVSVRSEPMMSSSPPPPFSPFLPVTEPSLVIKPSVNEQENNQNV